MEKKFYDLHFAAFCGETNTPYIWTLCIWCVYPCAHLCLRDISTKTLTEPCWSHTNHSQPGNCQRQWFNFPQQGMLGLAWNDEVLRRVIIIEAGSLINVKNSITLGTFKAFKMRATLNYSSIHVHRDLYNVNPKSPTIINWFIKDCSRIYISLSHVPRCHCLT